MFNKIKTIFAGNEETQVSPTPSNSNPVISQTDDGLSSFYRIVHRYSEHENVPKAVKEVLSNITTLLANAGFSDLPMNFKLPILRTLEVEIPKHIDIYLTLPKAYAVSYILDNGKTSKVLLVDTIIGIYNSISNELETVNIKKAQSLINSTNQKQLPKSEIDFFDM